MSSVPPHSEHELDEILALPAGRRIEPLVALGRQVLAGSARDNGLSEQLIEALLELIRNCAGDSQQRLQMGEVLGYLGDPRLRVPENPAYWKRIEMPEHPFLVGRHPVTNMEFRNWVDAGGYRDSAHWSPEGLAWRDAQDKLWPELAEDPEVATLVVPNQPVVGLTWYEAEAYATAKGARLLSLDERRYVVRGAEKRPYPWGEPFGAGNANTREEVLGRPCAVGIFYSDHTPEGVWDLAGNVAEWCADGNERLRVIHPGSWQQPAMASWAKALEMIDPTTRSADLGMRLARNG